MLPLIFIAIPLIEIALFVTIGGAIGLGWTLAIVVLTALIGVTMLRAQGQSAMTDLRSSFSEVRDPTEPLAHGAMIIFSGALLLTPGFFTDAIGFSLLIPGVRSAMYKRMRERMNVQTFDMNGNMRDPRAPRDRVIDGEFEEVDQDSNGPSNATSQPSGWTRDDRG
ncbi:MAG: FxsA family protein [Pseudomonadota bacterium]